MHFKVRKAGFLVSLTSQSKMWKNHYDLENFKLYQREEKINRMLYLVKG